MKEVTATFPQDAGQYAGTHHFDSLGARARSIGRAVERGIDVKNVEYVPNKPRKYKKKGQK